jgi:hypothetical protein
MKYIQKQNEPQEFTDWKNQANENWQPIWDTLRSQVKQRLKAHIPHPQLSPCLLL